MKNSTAIYNPLVTVIIPFYKPGTKLDDAVKSIIEQTFSNWELILVNNNACEISTSIANKWCLNDNRIKTIHEPVQSVAHAMNTGIRNANADLIARLDADDISFPTRLQKQLEYMVRHPETGVVSTQTAFASEIERSRGFALFVDWQNRILTHEDHSLARFVESPVAQPTILFRKKLISLYGYYDTGNVPEDYELWLRWLEKGVIFHKIPEPLVQWNDHTERLTRTHPNYSEDAFMAVRYEYLARWIRANVESNKKIIICGSSSNIKRKAERLSVLGLRIEGFTDVKPPGTGLTGFIPYAELQDPSRYFILNLISKRGVGSSIRNHFGRLGFIEGKDLILAG